MKTFCMPCIGIRGALNSNELVDLGITFWKFDIDLGVVYSGQRLEAGLQLSINYALFVSMCLLSGDTTLVC